jgi:DNA N-6-adenine-methyltransferase (Dam)
MSNIDACLTSKTNEHYTPLAFLLKVYEFFGGELDLDPCCHNLENPTVLAHLHYDEQMDGLSLPWIGKVFVNPPYGRTLANWTQKLCSEYECGNTSEALYLVPSRTDTKWTRRLGNYSRCYLSERIKFVSQDGREQDSAPFPSALFYLGTRQAEFTKFWNKYGEVWIAEGEKKHFDKTSYQREYMRKRRATNKI